MSSSPRTMSSSTRNMIAVGVAGVLSLVIPSVTVADAPEPSGSVTLTALGTYDGGGLARAEVVAYDRELIPNGGVER